MGDQKELKLFCQTCQRYFSTMGARNRHIRNFHPEIELTLVNPPKEHIICPLCRNEPFSFHYHFLKHLTEHHKVKINFTDLKFANFQEFTAWKEKREVDYSCLKTVGQTDKNFFLYNCNGYKPEEFVSTNKKRKIKADGSININGTCPSRIEAKVPVNGEVLVQYIDTHIGHEICSKTLRENEVQLMAGISTNNILQDSRKAENNGVRSKKLLSDTNSSLLNTEPSTSWLHIKNDRQHFMDEISNTVSELRPDDTIEKFTLDGPHSIFPPEFFLPDI